MKTTISFENDLECCRPEIRTLVDSPLSCSLFFIIMFHLLKGYLFSVYVEVYILFGRYIHTLAASSSLKSSFFRPSVSQPQVLPFNRWLCHALRGNNPPLKWRANNTVMKQNTPYWQAPNCWSDVADCTV